MTDEQRNGGSALPSSAESPQVPLCGQEGCGCPTQADLDAYQERQWHDAGRAVAAMTGLTYDEQEGFRAE